MGQNFKETAHLNTDTKKYESNYDRIFGKDGPSEAKDEAIGSIYEAYDYKTLAARCLCLEEQLADAEEVIEFYADYDNWKKQNQNAMTIICREDREIDFLRTQHGGKQAREYQEKYE